MKTGVELITEERQRQIEKECWTPEHDDSHRNGELARAAACYATHRLVFSFMGKVCGWPWDVKWWKPKDPIRDLIRAGALIAAEIDRLQRMEK